MKDIAIYGAGGFGCEIACLIKTLNDKEPTWNLIGFFDDGLEKASIIKYGKILGGINDLNSFNEDLAVALAIGTPDILYRIVSKITNPKIFFPNIFTPDLVFLDASSVKFGMGNIICSRSIISCNVVFENFNILNLSVTIGHDTTIGSFNVFMPAVNISGTVKIGDKNFMGVSSVILQHIKMGNGVRVGAGSVIMRKTEDNCLYIGNPAVKVRF